MKNQKKTVRIVTFSFPPDETMASQRLKRIVNGFLKTGWQVEIYATAPRHFRSDGKRDEFNLTDDVTVYRHNSLLIEIGLTLRAAIKRLRGVLSPSAIQAEKTYQNADAAVQLPNLFKLFPDLYILSAGRIYFHDMYKRVTGRRADLVVASGPVFSTFVIADRLAKWNGAPLILDYRDPWTGSDYIKSRQSATEVFLTRERETEVEIMSRATLVTTVSNGLRKMLADKTETEIRVAYNSLPAAERDPGHLTRSELPVWMQAEERFRIVYTGSLYGGRRDITPLLRALLRLEPALIDRIDLIALGPDSHLVKQISDRKGPAGLNVLVDKLSHDQARAIQKHSDLLVLINWNLHGSEPDYILTGKLFEYEATGNPVLGLGVDPQSEMAEFLGKRLNNLISTDPDQIVKFVRNLMTETAAEPTLAEDMHDIANAEHIAIWSGPAGVAKANSNR